MKVVYSPHYYADIGSHVFPMEKFRLIIEKLLGNGIIIKEEIIEPAIATEDEVLSVHTKEYIEKLKRDGLSPGEEAILELPYSKDLFTAFLYTCGGTITAGRIALKDGIGINVGGGFHHAFSDHGEGFCLLNDIAVGIEVLKREGKVRKVLVVDCDLHQGNGTAAIFKADKSVYTYSIHQENIYPFFKEKSDWDVNLPPGTGDDDYLDILEEDIFWMTDKVNPDFLLYVAGADPYEKDQLGSLKLTMEGLERRDEIVLETAKRCEIPIVIVLAGGYAQELSDTVQIHYNTIKKAIEMHR